MTDYTDEERQTLRTAAFGAMMLVSNADPGFFATIKESMAGSKVLAGSSPELRDLLKSGGLPQVPKGSPAEMETGVLAALQQSTTILQSKAPAELDGFRSAIVAACDKVADASGGVTEPETAAVTKVKAALGVG
ncbi:hypothetical protein F4553_006336 [Allocatelliglobosispora scoriae]|uniref:Uncharacterized protein n=1 Tax=Allocatelliglobosispora scoriae TaxID=643052 RepID=A0A841C1G2_9ACTN|nr:hypothetical protein [Allocatelliglobosispora scoriae]MBB5872902.1 hypothetical protein [Allocatelliglobosispora scoriae]